MAYPDGRTSRCRTRGARAGVRPLDTPWDHGPFAEPARELLRAHAGGVRERLHAYDQLAGRMRDEPGPWVVTHGEPHSANVIRVRGRPAAGGLGHALIGPRERDLWMMLDADLTGWDEYREVVGSVRLNEDALGLYRERWALAESASTWPSSGDRTRRPRTRGPRGRLGEYLA